MSVKLAKMLKQESMLLENYLKQNAFIYTNHVSILLLNLKLIDMVIRNLKRMSQKTPIKENDHLMDMISYVLYMQVGKGTNSFATVHYSQSAMPQNHNDMSLPNAPKRATTHYAKL